MAWWVAVVVAAHSLPLALLLEGDVVQQPGSGRQVELPCKHQHMPGPAPLGDDRQRARGAVAARRLRRRPRSRQVRHGAHRDRQGLCDSKLPRAGPGLPEALPARRACGLSRAPPSQAPPDLHHPLHAPRQRGPVQRPHTAASLAAPLTSQATSPVTTPRSAAADGARSTYGTTGPGPRSHGASPPKPARSHAWTAGTDTGGFPARRDPEPCHRH